MLLPIQIGPPAIDLGSVSSAPVLGTSMPHSDAIRIDPANVVAKFQVGRDLQFGLGGPRFETRVVPTEEAKLAIAKEPPTMGTYVSVALVRESQRSPDFYRAYSYAPRNMDAKPTDYERLSHQYIGRDITRKNYSFLDSGPTP